MPAGGGCRFVGPEQKGQLLARHRRGGSGQPKEQRPHLAARQDEWLFLPEDLARPEKANAHVRRF